MISFYDSSLKLFKYSNIRERERKKNMFKYGVYLLISLHRINMVWKMKYYANETGYVYTYTFDCWKVWNLKFEIFQEREKYHIYKSQLWLLVLYKHIKSKYLIIKNGW